MYIYIYIYVYIYIYGCAISMNTYMCMTSTRCRFKPSVVREAAQRMAGAGDGGVSEPIGSEHLLPRLASLASPRRPRARLGRAAGGLGLCVST